MKTTRCKVRIGVLPKKQRVQVMNNWCETNETVKKKNKRGKERNLKDSRARPERNPGKKQETLYEVIMVALLGMLLDPSESTSTKYQVL